MLSSSPPLHSRLLCEHINALVMVLPDKLKAEQKDRAGDEVCACESSREVEEAATQSEKIDNASWTEKKKGWGK